jgi:putative transposase
MDPQGYDAGKKVTGRKRHILVDTLGLLLSVAVHSADIQDRDGAAFVLNTSTRALFPFIERIFADGGYQGPRAAEAAAATGKWIIEIVKRNELHKFVVLPNGGSSNEPSLGSVAIAASHAISNAMRPPWPLSFASR